MSGRNDFQREMAACTSHLLPKRGSLGSLRRDHGISSTYLYDLEATKLLLNSPELRTTDVPGEVNFWYTYPNPSLRPLIDEFGDRPQELDALISLTRLRIRELTVRMKVLASLEEQMRVYQLAMKDDPGLPTLYMQPPSQPSSRALITIDDSGDTTDGEGPLHDGN